MAPTTPALALLFMYVYHTFLPSLRDVGINNLPFYYGKILMMTFYHNHDAVSTSFWLKSRADLSSPYATENIPHMRD